MATKQELEGLQKLASQYGGADSQQFKDYVNQTAGTGTYDTLMAGLKNQASVQTAPAPVSNGKIDTTTGQEVQQPIQPITTPTPTQAPNIPQPIQEAPKAEIQAPKVEVKTDINEALNPKWQQGVDKALESGQNVKTKLDEGLKAGTIDQTTYNQANNYLKQKEQVAGDQKAQELNDENFIFQALQTGQNIKGTTPAYFKAKGRYDIANKYQSLTEEQLYNAYINGEISGQLEKDIAGNPYLAVAKDKFNKKLVTDNINQEATYMLNAYNKANGKTTVVKTEKTALETLNEKFLNLFNNMGKSEDEIVSFKEHLANNYPSLVEETKELNAKNKQARELADQRDARLDEIIKENPGISINRATMLAARQNKDINNQIKSLSSEIANLSANVQYQTNLADKEYGYLLQEQSRQDQLAQEQRGYAFDILKQQQAREQTLEDRAYNEQQAQKQLEQKFAYEYGDINSTDPNVQRVAVERAVADMYNKYPIVGMESQATKVQKVQDRIAQGMTGAEAIASVEQEIRNSPAYKDLMAKQKAEMTPTATTPKLEKIGTDANGKDIYGTYNAKTGKYEPISVNPNAVTPNGNVDFTKLDFSNNVSLINKYPKEASFKNNNPTGITWGINANTKKLLEDAGINYGLGTARPANEGGNYIKFDSVQDGLDAYMVLLTKAGTNDVYNRLKQWVGTAEGDSYANKLMSQAGITKGAKFSDLSQEQLSGLMSAQLQKESPNFYKELSNMPAETTFTDEVKSWGDNIINAVGGAKITSIQDKALRTQVSNYIAQKSKAEPNKEVFTIKNALTLLNELEKHPGLEGAIGVGTKGKIPATASASFMAKLSQLEAQQFLEGIQQMKGMGALSNAEGQKVSAAASSLINTAQSEKEWKAELKKIKDILQGKINTIEQTTGLKFDDMGSPTTGDMEISNTGTDLRSKYFDNP